MTKKTCDYNPVEIIREMVRWNDGVSPGKTPGGELVLVSSVHPSNLKFPDGWCWNPKNGLTNKRQTSTGCYECINVTNLGGDVYK